jgi:hypothetical protein
MSKFNKGTVRAPGRSPISGETIPSGTTHEGAPGFAREAKSELFLLGVANMGAEDSFYESGKERDSRYARLVRQLAVEDLPWLTSFLSWLRSDANMRTAPLIGAAEAVKARQEAKEPGGRALIASVLQRGDEPGELLAYWLGQYGKPVPISVKRGLADAVVRLYDERSLLKYDSDSRAVRFGDVIDLVTPAYHHPEIRGTWRYDLLGCALDRRHGRDNEIPETLGMLRRHAALMAIPQAERNAFIRDPEGIGRLADAGITWEALAGWLNGPMDAAAWQAVIPSMGIFALVRNLRNFDQAGVPDDVAGQVSARISDPAAVAESRMFPFRFWAAHKHTASMRWGHALDKAITASLASVPALPGRTLILVDRSPSMFPGYGFSTPSKSDIPLAEMAALFGSAVALRAESPTLAEFGGQSREIPVSRGGSVLRLAEQFTQSPGTDIPSAVKRHYAGHDRVLIVTDEQTRPGYLPSNMLYNGGMGETFTDSLIPAHVPVYMWNFAGYSHGAAPAGHGNRHAMGGLTDQAFRMVPLLEAGKRAAYPWEQVAGG